MKIVKRFDEMSERKVVEEQSVAGDDEDIFGREVSGLDDESDVGDGSQSIHVRLGSIVHDCH